MKPTQSSPNAAPQAVHGPGFLRQIAPGASWLLGDRIIRAFLELAVGLWIARHLGPAEFGHLSFALALAALLGPLSGMGLHGLMVRELVARPAEAARTLGSGAALRFVGGLAGGAVLIAGSFAVVESDPTRAELMRIVAILVALSGVEILDLQLQAADRMAASAIGRSLAAILAGGARVALIMAGAGVVSFAWIAVVEVVIWGGVLVMIYWSSGGRLSRWRADAGRARELFSESWLLVLSGIGALLNLKIDQVMLGTMSTTEQLGTYAAAARLSEGLYFIPYVLATAAFPAILRSRESDQTEYAGRLKALFDILGLIAASVVLGGLLVGPWLLSALLGEAFAGSASIFRIHVLACFFVYPGIVLSRVLIAEGFMGFSLARHVLGAGTNIGLNLMLIPLYGGMGAAVSTVASYAASALVAPSLWKPTRSIARLMAGAPFRIPMTVISVAGAVRRYAGSLKKGQ